MAEEKQGRVIEVPIAVTHGQVVTLEPKRWSWIKLRQRMVELFKKKYADKLPQPMGSIVADCAHAGIRPGQGKGPGFLSEEEQLARETASTEGYELLPQYRAKAKAEGRPKGWASEQVAAKVRERMCDLGVKNPPSVATIRKRGLRTKSAT
jgi:hypothetical protein